MDEKNKQTAEGGAVNSAQPLSECVFNLTQHPATPEQVAQGVIDPPQKIKEELRQLLTFEELPTPKEVEDRAHRIVVQLKNWLDEIPFDPQTGEPSIYIPYKAMIGGAPFLMAPLEKALRESDFTPVYAFSLRVSEEKVNPDGSVVKTQVFKHLGFVEGAL
jgi:hypothetical protein